MFDKCLHPGSDLQFAPPCDHRSKALPTELPPLIRNYLWNFVNYRKQIKYDLSELDTVGILLKFSLSDFYTSFHNSAHSTVVIHST